MPAPVDTPHIKTTYKTDGTMVQEPKGFGGTLCQKATQPYLWRQGFGKSKRTAEADEPSYLERESEGGEKARA